MECHMSALHYCNILGVCCSCEKSYDMQALLAELHRRLCQQECFDNKRLKMPLQLNVLKFGSSWGFRVLKTFCDKKEVFLPHCEPIQAYSKPNIANENKLPFVTHVNGDHTKL